MKAQQEAVDFINNNQEEAQNIAIDAIKELTKQELDKEFVKQAMDEVNYTTEVDEAVIKEFAQSSYELQFLKETPNLDGLVDTTL